MAKGVPEVGLIMGSQSDWDTMRHSAYTLISLGVRHDVQVVSAHRTPKRLVEYAEGAEGRGLRVIIAAAGGAAHLPGMVASLTTLPVIGVPLDGGILTGLDSLLSTLQMPKGVPVGTLAIGDDGAINAALLAASIISLNDPKIKNNLKKWLSNQSKSVKKRPK